MPLHMHKSGASTPYGGIVSFGDNSRSLMVYSAGRISRELIKLFSIYGHPRILHSDQGRNFESTIMAQTLEAFGTTKSRTTAYHPQGDGMVERFNHSLLQLLRVYVDKKVRMGTVSTAGSIRLPHCYTFFYRVFSIHADVWAPTQHAYCRVPKLLRLTVLPRSHSCHICRVAGPGGE